jgi:hypothetical protein
MLEAVRANFDVVFDPRVVLFQFNIPSCYFEAVACCGGRVTVPPLRNVSLQVSARQAVHQSAPYSDGNHIRGVTRRPVLHDIILKYLCYGINTYFVNLSRNVSLGTVTTPRLGQYIVLLEFVTKPAPKTNDGIF